MNKTAIKNYAIWARNTLIEAVEQRAFRYGITEKDCGDPMADSVNGFVLTTTEKKQRQALIAKIREKGYGQVMEEAAYTWFNRFIALRFMEVNGYLPTRVRVFTDEENAFKPQILSEATHLELDGLKLDRVIALKETNKTEELFKYLLITQCNALSAVLPGMFQKIEDYTELLLPDNLLREGSVIEQLVATIPEEDWTDQVQIIGWLYQFYNTEQNELVYDGNWARERIKKELLPAATTIYTPDWPVKYMVENSLGRLWLEGHPNDALKPEWKYYLDEAEQEPEVQAQLASIRKEYATLKPEEIRVIDPCMGSGHILCVLFDVLVRIYEDYGYTAREAAASIVENNLWGLDIDDRASQLAYFSVMMKARQYDRRFFSREVQPHVYAVVESNGLDPYCVEYFINGRTDLKTAMDSVVKEMRDAKEYGSILKAMHVDFSKLYERFDEISQESEPSMYSQMAIDTILPLIQCVETFSTKYHVVVTNPPYLSNSRFSDKLDSYVKDKYPDEKADLSMVMLKKSMDDLCAKAGFVAFITTSSWLFLSSFEQTRNYMLTNMCIDSLVDFGTELFEGKVGHNPITSWVNRNAKIDYTLTSIRLVDFCYSRRDEKEPEFFKTDNRYHVRNSALKAIPSSPIIYWASSNLLRIFDEPKLIEFAKPRQGLATGENNRFLRFWYECIIDHIKFDAENIADSVKSGARWFPYNKGGEFRKWYGNNDYVVNWFNDGYEIRHFVNDKGKLRSRPQNTEAYFHESITWSKISSGSIAFRYKPNGHIFDVAGTSIFASHNMLLYLQGLCNSVVALTVFNAISPTLNYEVGHIASLPVIVDASRRDIVETLVNDNIKLSCADWDAFEVSWDFKEHPFISSVRLARGSGETVTIKQAFGDWQEAAERRFIALKENEEKLNSIFIDIYGLNDELISEVDDKDVTVRKADLQREVRSFISYAVGCMFGRYSLDTPGLVYAGDEWKASAYSRFKPDKDAIIPICEDEYFEDDIVGRFVKFVETAFGKATLEENLRFIADALGGKGSSRDVIRSYFINDFYADHLKIYQKRPIYWLFDSGKKNGFKCLIYMHRYQPDTIARIRTDYVHEQQSRYRTAIADLEQRVEIAAPAERVKLNKQLQKLRDQAAEVQKYEEKIHHLADQMIKIDLDDGVKVNYAKFEDVLAKIK